MKEKLSALFKNKNTARILFIIGMAGILLIFASSFFPKTENSQKAQTEFSQKEFCDGLKQDISAIVQGICGDASAVVALTLDSDIVYEYADEIKQNNAEDEKKTSEESEKSYITVKDAGGSEKPLIVTAYMPQIRGVSIICSANDTAAQEIKNAVCAALNISSRKIYIGRKQGNEKN